MTFLTPAFLWLLPIAITPLLLHLLNKRPPQTVTFSHIKWLQDAHKKRMPKKRIKEVLLMLMRMLMLIFLILFFSRPVIRQGKLWLNGNAELKQTGANMFRFAEPAYNPEWLQFLDVANGKAQHVKLSGYDLWRVEVR